MPVWLLRMLRNGYWKTKRSAASEIMQGKTTIWEEFSEAMTVHSHKWTCGCEQPHVLWLVACVNRLRKAKQGFPLQLCTTEVTAYLDFHRRDRGSGLEKLAISHAEVN